MSDAYQSIDCGLHSELEWLILRKQPLLIHWQHPQDGTQRHEAMLQDLVTQDGAEWLIARSPLSPLRIRLDWLDQVGKLTMRTPQD